MSVAWLACVHQFASASMSGLAPHRAKFLCHRVVVGLKVWHHHCILNCKPILSSIAASKMSLLTLTQIPCQYALANQIDLKVNHRIGLKQYFNT